MKIMKVRWQMRMKGKMKLSDDENKDGQEKENED